MLDESNYLSMVDSVFRKLQDTLDQVDPDLVDVSRTGDVVTLAFQNGVRCVLNTQRPVRQIWMAARADAWHFSWNADQGSWLDDKGRGYELFGTVAKVVREQAGLELSFPR